MLLLVSGLFENFCLETFEIIWNIDSFGFLVSRIFGLFFKIVARSELSTSPLLAGSEGQAGTGGW